MRRRRHRPALPAAWQSIAEHRLRHWEVLSQHERTALEERARVLLTKRWEASHGFALTDEMQVTVALNAALLYLGRDDEPFPNVSSVVIHPATIVLRGERPGPFPGVKTDAPLPTLGHTSARGPVFIAWDAVERDLAAPQRGSNVILHEFAHKLDALDGLMDGTPKLDTEEQLRDWVAVCTAELAALRRGERSVLRGYAATNPSEFFAVATEMFFGRPTDLLAAKPDLYRVLLGFYRQDTAAREPLPPAPAQPAFTVTWTTVPDGV